MNCESRKDDRKSGCGCIGDIVSLIVRLQNCTEECDSIGCGCDKPFLGPRPSFVCFNTRPVRFFRCCDGEAWNLPYTYNNTTGTSDVFRVESIDGCCATARILIPNPDTTAAPNSTYIATETCVTINLDCVGALSCLADTFVPNL